MESLVLHSVRTRIAAGVVVGLCVMPNVARAQGAETGAGTEPPRGPATAWSSFLPILGAEAERRGYELPLPFGISVNGFALNEPYRVEELRLSLNDGAPRSVSSQLLRVSAVEVAARSTTLRADVWLFPFLNVYGIGGYSRGKAVLGLTLLPGAQGLTKEIRIPTLRYEGPTYGGGVVLAGGYKNFFATLDANRTTTRVDLLDSHVNTVVVGSRLGWRQKFGDVHGSWWLGAMYQKSSQTMTGSVSAAADAPSIRFEVDQTTDKPWNLLIGTQWELGPHWWCLLEGGLGDRKQVLGSVNYRF
ncbi:MAG: hypothetical protein RR101_13935 [Burkholderiaceae bacterium]